MALEAATRWRAANDAERELDAHVTKAAPVPDQQLEWIHGQEARPAP